MPTSDLDPTEPPADPRADKVRWYDHGISALNGVVGDWLHATRNGLAIEAAFQRDGKPLPIERAALSAAFPASSGRLCVLVHGHSANEASWRGPSGSDYGTRLEAELGITPLYLRYNSGRHVSENGAALATLLEALVGAFPVLVTELDLVGHSMGGLVVRSACAAGTKLGHAWVGLVARVVTLGSPHHGAPLEKFGNALTHVLSRIPHPVAQVPAEILNARSAGVKDLRYGSTRDEDWAGRDPDELLTDRRGPAFLLPHARSYVVAGTLAADPESWLARAFGDAMVRLPSALGVDVPAERKVRLAGVSHLGLAHDDAVFDYLRRWFTEPREAP